MGHWNTYKEFVKLRRLRFSKTICSVLLSTFELTCLENSLKKGHIFYRFPTGNAFQRQSYLWKMTMHKRAVMRGERVTSRRTVPVNTWIKGNKQSNQCKSKRNQSPDKQLTMATKCTSPAHAIISKHSHETGRTRKTLFFLLTSLSYQLKLFDVFFFRSDN